MPLVMSRRRLAAMSVLLLGGIARSVAAFAEDLQSSPQSEGPSPPTSSGPGGEWGPLEFSKSVGPWSIYVKDGRGSAAITPDHDEAWVVRDAVLDMSGAVILSGTLGVEFGPDKRLYPVFRFDIIGGPGAAGRTPAASVDHLIGREFLLKSKGKILGRVTPASFPWTIPLGEVAWAGDAPGHDAQGAIDAMAREETISASVVLDGGELVFFEQKPSFAMNAFVEMKRETLAQLDELSRRTSTIPDVGGGGCFLTTACCELLGRPDDCFELTTLRRYRDNVLDRLPGGRADIAWYYAFAPLILREIRRQGRERVLLRLYVTHILPCAILAQIGAAGLTRRLYRDMMLRLGKRFL